jgi:hypothetical protein
MMGAVAFAVGVALGEPLGFAVGLEDVGLSVFTLFPSGLYENNGAALVAEGFTEGDFEGDAEGFNEGDAEFNIVGPLDNEGFTGE